MVRGVEDSRHTDWRAFGKGSSEHKGTEANIEYRTSNIEKDQERDAQDA